MSRDTLTFEEVLDLVNRPPSLARTLDYITRRGCWPERPFPKFAPEELADHVKALECVCFACGNRRPEWAGTCYGNSSCQIWVCAECAPLVKDSLACERCNQLASIRDPEVKAALDSSYSTAEVWHTCALGECQIVRCPRCGCGYHRPGSRCVYLAYGTGEPHAPRWDRVCKCGVRIFPAPPDWTATAAEGGTL